MTTNTKSLGFLKSGQYFHPSCHLLCCDIGVHLNDKQFSCLYRVWMSTVPCCLRNITESYIHMGKTQKFFSWKTIYITDQQFFLWSFNCKFMYFTTIHWCKLNFHMNFLFEEISWMKESATKAESHLMIFFIDPKYLQMAKKGNINSRSDNQSNFHN